MSYGSLVSLHPIGMMIYVGSLFTGFVIVMIWGIWYLRRKDNHNTNEVRK